MSTAARHSAYESFHGRTGFLLVELGKAAWAMADRQLRPLGLTGRHVEVLALAASAAESQQGMVARTGIDRTTMVALVDDLERLGYAARDRDPADRRRHLVTVTDAGRRALRTASAALDRAENDLFDEISADERRRLHDMAGRLLARLPPVHDRSGQGC